MARGPRRFSQAHQGPLPPELVDFLIDAVPKPGAAPPGYDTFAEFDYDRWPAADLDRLIVEHRAVLEAECRRRAIPRPWQRQLTVSEFRIPASEGPGVWDDCDPNDD